MTTQERMKVLESLSAKELAMILGSVDSETMNKAQELAKDDIKHNRAVESMKKAKANNLDVTYDRESGLLTIVVDTNVDLELNKKHTKMFTAKSSGWVLFDETNDAIFNINVMKNLTDEKIEELKKANSYNIKVEKK